VRTSILWLLLVTAPAAPAGERSKSYEELPGFRPSEAVLWRDPGAVEERDLRYGPGGKALEPKAPFTFEKEDMVGTSPKVQVHDANGRRWVVKFGDESRPDTFASRLAWAVGYYAEPNYFLEGETIEGAHGLKRAHKYIDEDGRAQGGRFQLRTKDPQYMSGYSWGWRENPFVGTAPMNGLRVLMMLVSNWDDKDIRDNNQGGPVVAYHEMAQWMRRGTNNAVMRVGGAYVFFVDDWGASMGKWGNAVGRNKWDCAGFREESAHFVRGVRDGEMEWGFDGLHTANVAAGIRAADVRWLLQYLGRLTDEQLRAGLLASGATPDEAYCYTEALRMRIGQLQDAASGRTAAADE